MNTSSLVERINAEFSDVRRPQQADIYVEGLEVEAPGYDCSWQEYAKKRDLVISNYGSLTTIGRTYYLPSYLLFSLENPGHDMVAIDALGMCWPRTDELRNSFSNLDCSKIKLIDEAVRTILNRHPRRKHDRASCAAFWEELASSCD